MNERFPQLKHVVSLSVIRLDTPTRTPRGEKTPVIAFADGMVEAMSTLGKGLVMPALDAKIKELFGFEFSELLVQVGGGAKKRSMKRITKRAGSKTTNQAAKKK